MGAQSKEQFPFGDFLFADFVLQHESEMGFCLNHTRILSGYQITISSLPEHSIPNFWQGVLEGRSTMAFDNRSLFATLQRIAHARTVVGTCAQLRILRRLVWCFCERELLLYASIFGNGIRMEDHKYNDSPIALLRKTIIFRSVASLFGGSCVLSLSLSLSL